MLGTDPKFFLSGRRRWHMNVKASVQCDLEVCWCGVLQNTLPRPCIHAYDACCISKRSHVISILKRHVQGNDSKKIPVTFIQFITINIHRKPILLPCFKRNQQPFCYFWFVRKVFFHKFESYINLFRFSYSTYIPHEAVAEVSNITNPEEKMAG